MEINDDGVTPVIARCNIGPCINNLECDMIHITVYDSDGGILGSGVMEPSQIKELVKDLQNLIREH